MKFSKCIAFACLTLFVFFLCLVLFPSCVRSVEPEPRVLVTVSHHTAELKHHTLGELQSLYSPAMIFIGEKTLNTIPAGMELKFSIPVGTELVANWMEYDPNFGIIRVRVDGLIADRDTTWRIGE